MDAPDALPLFALDGVSFTHPDSKKRVLSGVSLNLWPGERLGILGRNGSGKSTLLHIGAGLLKPDKGLVRFGGRACSEEKDFIRERKSLGYLLQRAEDQLFCATVLEDVAFGPYNLGHSEEEAENMAVEMLAGLNLSHLAEKNGQRLSGGEQKLAALATILVMRPALLFLDEPTNDLDEEARGLLLAVLERVRLPSVIVSHDLPFLLGACSRFCRLDNGVLCEDNAQA